MTYKPDTFEVGDRVYPAWLLRTAGVIIHIAESTEGNGQYCNIQWDDGSNSSDWGKKLVPADTVLQYYRFRDKIKDRLL